MEVIAIGTVRSPVAEPVDEGWGSVVAEIVLAPDLAEGLRGLENFSHALVVFFMHRATFDPKSNLVRHPQGRTDLPLCGIFAQRAKHRPNPIGITVVRVIAREDNVLRVRGLDAIDGTPVLDVKPYFPQYDRAEDPRLPAWVSEIMRDYF